MPLRGIVGPYRPMPSYRPLHIPTAWEVFRNALLTSLARAPFQFGAEYAGTKWREAAESRLAAQEAEQRAREAATSLAQQLGKAQGSWEAMQQAYKEPQGPIPSGSAAELAMLGPTPEHFAPSKPESLAPVPNLAVTVPKPELGGQPHLLPKEQMQLKPPIGLELPANMTPTPQSTAAEQVSDLAKLLQSAPGVSSYRVQVKTKGPVRGIKAEWLNYFKVPAGGGLTQTREALQRLGAEAERRGNLIYTNTRNLLMQRGFDQQQAHRMASYDQIYGDLINRAQANGEDVTDPRVRAKLAWQATQKYAKMVGKAQGRVVAADTLMQRSRQYMQLAGQLYTMAGQVGAEEAADVRKRAGMMMALAQQEAVLAARMRYGRRVVPLAKWLQEHAGDMARDALAQMYEGGGNVEAVGDNFRRVAEHIMAIAEGPEGRTLTKYQKDLLADMLQRDPVNTFLLAGGGKYMRTQEERTWKERKTQADIEREKEQTWLGLLGLEQKAKQWAQQLGLKTLDTAVGVVKPMMLFGQMPEAEDWRNYARYLQQAKQWIDALTRGVGR